MPAVLCARCQRQVLICSRCDRGQRYCGAHCSGTPEVNHDVRRGTGINNRGAAGTAMPSASAATGAGAAKGPAHKK